MATIEQNLQTLISDRNDIKEAINNLGGNVGDSMSTYADAINEIVSDYLCFKCVSSEGATVTFNHPTGISGTLYYKKEGTSSWNQYINTEITLTFNQKVRFKGTFTNGTATSTSNYCHFSITAGKIVASGNIMSLISQDNFKSLTTLPASYCFYRLFFSNPYLVTPPNLPALTLTEGCYSNMFSGCTGLVIAPELPATTLATSCYYQMFYGCSSIVSAPILPALALVSNCYANMFRDCSSLSYIKALFLTTPGRSYTGTWVTGVASSGTFVKNSSATWTTTGTSGVPTGWTVETE